MARPVRPHPHGVDADVLASLRASPRSRIAATLGDTIAESVGIGGRRRADAAVRWHPPSESFRHAQDLLGDRPPRQILLTLTTDRLVVHEIGLSGRCGRVRLDVASTMLGDAVVEPARILGVGVLYLDLTIGDTALPLVVARPHRDDARHLVEQWRRLVGRP